MTENVSAKQAFQDIEYRAKYTLLDRVTQFSSLFLLVVFAISVTSPIWGKAINPIISISQSVALQDRDLNDIKDRLADLEAFRDKWYPRQPLKE